MEGSKALTCDSPAYPRCLRPNRSSIVRSSEKWLYGSWLVVPPLTNGESSNAPTWPPPFADRPGIAPVGAARLGNCGWPQHELESANSPVDGASSTVITSRPPSL